jgi:predicted permease
VVILTLGVGIGAPTTIFSLINGVLLKPLPYDEADRLVGVWNTAPGLGYDRIPQSAALNLMYAEEHQIFEDVGVWTRRGVAITGTGAAEELTAIVVTDGVLPALRVQPVLGRGFIKADDSPGAPRTVILSHRYWHTRFGGDPGVLGQTIRIDGAQREIIGVMPRDFRFLQHDPVLFLPFQWDPAQLSLGNFSYESLGRLQPGVDIPRATAELAPLVFAGVERFPGGIPEDVLREARWGPNLQPLKATVVGDVGEVLWVLLGTAALVLLVACANVANLFLVRGEVREREVAVRNALGADRGQIAAGFLSDSIVLGLLGGAVGLVLAKGGLQLLKGFSSDDIPRLSEISLDPAIFAFAFLLAILAGVSFGVLPVMKYGRMSLVGALKEGGRGSSSGRRRNRGRNALVVSQVALALVLLVGSGLMVRSFQALRNVDPGYRDPDRLLTVRINIPGTEVTDQLAMARTHEAVSQSLGVIPGVVSAAISSSVAMDGRGGHDPIFVEEFPLPEGTATPPVRRFKWIGEGYFEAMGNPMVAGRSITWADIHDWQRVVVVNEAFASEYWPDPSQALGKRIGPGFGGEDWFEIVGVVGNVRDDGLSQDPTPIVYWPQIVTSPWWADQLGSSYATRRSMVHVIRSPRVGTEVFLKEVREAVQTVNPNLPVASVRTMAQVQADSMVRTSFTLFMLVIASGVALFLGLVGIYGVVSYAVSQRTREFGVHLAVGAQARDVTGMVLRQGFLLAGLGVVLGLGSALGLTRLLETLLFGVNPLDPLTFGSVAGALTAVALLASYLPARRAATTDPLVALRAE